MGNPSSLEDLVDLIYQAAIDAQLWPAVLDRFVERIDGEAATLHWYDLFSGHSHGVGARVDQAALDQAFADYAWCSPLTEKDPAKKRRRLRNYSPRIRRDTDWLPKEEFVKTQYYNDFFQSFGFHSDITLGLMVEDVGGGAFEGAGLNVFRHKRRGAWSAADMAVCSALHPHLVRSFRMGRRIAANRLVGESLIEFFERAPWGVFLLDAQGRLDHANQAARTLLAEDHGLTLLGRRLSACRPAEARRLQQLVALAACADAEQRSGGAMPLPTGTRRRPLSVTVSPLRGDRASLFPGSTAVVVIVTDLDATTTLPEKELRDLFGLTLAEARVALAVAEDLDAAAIAERFGVGMPTVRTHLSRIFDKTETAGRASLSHLLTRLAAGPRQDG
jgi:DNA-binding CsgD family transcriptional regulator